MKVRTLVSAYMILVLGASVASAYHANHFWQKQSEHIVTNSFGQQVLQCTWICRANLNEQHTTTTVGMSTNFCPMPSF